MSDKIKFPNENESTTATTSNRKARPRFRLDNKFTITFVTIFLVFILSFIVSVGYALFLNDKIMNGIVVSGINAGGLTKNQLNQSLSTKFGSDLSQKKMTLSVNGMESSFSFSDAKIKYDIAKACDLAYSFGRKGNLLERFISVALSKTQDVQIQVDCEFDKKFTENKVQEFAKKVNKPVQEYQLAYSPPFKATISTGHRGESLDLSDALAKVEFNIKNGIDGKLTLKSITTKPKPLDAKDIYLKIASEPKDAYAKVVNNKIEIVPATPGRKIDIGTLSSILEGVKYSEDRTAILPVVFSNAKLNISDVEKKLFKDSISSFSTQFYTGDKNNDNRKNNITIAASKINGKLLGPDEEFSFNQVVGPRNPENGYKDAHAYVGGKIVDSTGGGICQVSTTLYNAILLADLEVSERHNHMFTVAYVPKGRDAAVAYGSADFKFKNSSKWPLRINCWVSTDNKIFFALTGTNESPGKKIDFRYVTLSESAPQTVTVNDPNLNQGETVVDNEGMYGYVVDTYKIVQVNGSSKEVKLPTSSYNPLNKNVRVGTKKSAPTVINPSSPVAEKTRGIDDAYNPPVKSQ